MSFSFESFAGTRRTFALRDGHPPIVLDADGVRHPRNPRRPERQQFTAYEAITHLASSARVVWLGARDSVYLLPRAAFARYDAPEQLVAALMEAIAERPGGAAQLERMSRVQRTLETAGSTVATRSLIAICVVIYLLQWMLGPAVMLTGEYSTALVDDGDVWRVITANLLHAEGVAGIFHIGINMLALLPLGTMVERPLGTARTVCVMALSGVVAMSASGWFGTSHVVGASGIVFGLIGAVLWLDYRRAEELPAPWRFPRRSLLALVALNIALGALLPFIALAAHLGGFAAGALAAALVTGRVGTPSPLWTRAASALAIFATFSAVATAGMEVLRPGDPIARYTARMARLPGITAEEANNAAWILATATDPEPSHEVLVAALALAERAVAETQREEPTMLDTLAEVHFQLGEIDAALSVIDEAIRQDPDEVYYREQRRRFTGERAPGDRPDYVPPILRLPGAGPRDAEPEPPPPEETGLTV